MCLQRIAATPSTAQPRDQRAGKPGLTKLAVYYLPRSLGSQLLSALPPPILGACASPILGRATTLVDSQVRAKDEGRTNCSLLSGYFTPM